MLAMTSWCPRTRSRPCAAPLRSTPCTTCFASNSGGACSASQARAWQLRCVSRSTTARSLSAATSPSGSRPMRWQRGTPSRRGAVADSATIGEELSRTRDRAVRRIRKVGRRQWKMEVGYHRQARVENAFFRLKTILGDRMRARSKDAQLVEAAVACNILNRMSEPGRPESYAIGR